MVVSYKYFFFIEIIKKRVVNYHLQNCWSNRGFNNPQIYLMFGILIINNLGLQILITQTNSDCLGLEEFVDFVCLSDFQRQTY